MSISTLDPDLILAGSDRQLGRGHGAGALGPSDSSDCGSDVQGGPAAALEADPDSDTDTAGTGERAAAGPEIIAPDGADIGVDHIEAIPVADVGLDDADTALLAELAEREGREELP